MTIFDGFEDFSYFNRNTVLVAVILFIFFHYLTKSIYQSAVLSMSLIYVHYKYVERENERLTSKEVIDSYNDKIDALDNIKLEDYQKEIIKNTFPKSKYIDDYNNLTFRNFLFLNQEFYYYNPQAWIELITHIDKFLEIYNDITIDISKAGILYNSMKDLRDKSVESLVSIKISCPDKRTVIEKINISINELERIMNKYLFDVYVKNEINIKNNGYDNHTVIINPNLFDN